MIKRTYEELEPYFPAGHFGVTCKRYHGKDETGAQKFWIGVSDESISFPPNEGRGLKNESGKPAKMLVIINYPDAQ